MTSLLIVILLSISSMLAATLRDFRKILLCVWISHLLLGSLALQVGAVFFTLSVWMLGTVLAGVLFVFSLVFGEAIVFEKVAPSASAGSRTGEELLSTVGGGFLSVVVALTLLWVVGSEPRLLVGESAANQLGSPSREHLQSLAHHYFNEPILSIFMVALILLAAVLGVAVLTRARRQAVNPVDRNVAVKT